MFIEKLKKRLLYQKHAGLYRSPVEIEGRHGKHLLIKGEKILNFSSNDYLGLGTSEKLREKVAANFKKYGTSSSSSRLVTGNYSIIGEAEKKYAEYFGYDEALFFPSGYQANIGLLSALFEKGDTVIFDKHIHASSVKGLSLSGANIYGYKHSSMSHLEKKIYTHKNRLSAVITESLFSMDGDILDTNKFKEIKKKYKFLSIIDEAHSFGALGPGGRGITKDIADIAIGTFGKALGFFGAFILMPEGYREFLINFSSPFIYTTTLPEAHAASSIDLLEIFARSNNERDRLIRINRLMKENLENAGFSVKGDAHILIIEIGDEKKTINISKKLFEKNIFVFAARYPTVPLGKAILRLSLTAKHNEEDINLFIESMKEVYNETI